MQSWVDDTTANNSLMLRSTGTSDGVISRASEYGTTSQRPTLTVQ